MRFASTIVLIAAYLTAIGHVILEREDHAEESVRVGGTYQLAKDVRESICCACLDNSGSTPIGHDAAHMHEFVATLGKPGSSKLSVTSLLVWSSVPGDPLRHGWRDAPAMAGMGAAPHAASHRLVSLRC